jgi:hypothetical protein
MAEGQQGNDDEFAELQPCGKNVLAELRQVILVRAAYFLMRPWTRRRFKSRETWLTVRRQSNRCTIHICWNLLDRRKTHT